MSTVSTLISALVLSLHSTADPCNRTTTTAPPCEEKPEPCLHPCEESLQTESPPTKAPEAPEPCDTKTTISPKPCNTTTAAPACGNKGTPQAPCETDNAFDAKPIVEPPCEEDSLAEVHFDTDNHPHPEATFISCEEWGLATLSCDRGSKIDVLWGSYGSFNDHCDVRIPQKSFLVFDSPGFLHTNSLFLRIPVQVLLSLHRSVHCWDLR